MSFQGNSRAARGCRAGRESMISRGLLLELHGARQLCIAECWVSRAAAPCSSSRVAGNVSSVCYVLVSRTPVLISQQTPADAATLGAELDVERGVAADSGRLGQKAYAAPARKSNWKNEEPRTRTWHRAALRSERQKNALCVLTGVRRPRPSRRSEKWGLTGTRRPSARDTDKRVSSWPRAGSGLNRVIPRPPAR